MAKFSFEEFLILIHMKYNAYVISLQLEKRDGDERGQAPHS